jgi:cardiolipin synthase
MYSNEPALAWRDTDIEVTGPVVAEYQKLFVHTWDQQHGQQLDTAAMFPHLDRTGKKIVHVIGSEAHGLSVIYITLISAINNAQESVYITDPYFAPDHQMLGALKAAARRGVDVRLLLITQTDEPLIASAARSHYDSLMDAGIKIYQWRGTMLHCKTAVIDGVWSTVGSSNLDWWSIARNNEINTVVLNEDFAAAMIRTFNADLENSYPISPQQWDDRPVVEKAHEWMARFVQPLL